MPLQVLETRAIDLRYRTLYRLGGIASIVIALSIAFAIAAYFIWPYKGSTTSIEGHLHPPANRPDGRAHLARYFDAADCAD